MIILAAVKCSLLYYMSGYSLKNGHFSFIYLYVLKAKRVCCCWKPFL